MFEAYFMIIFKLFIIKIFELF